MKKLYLFILLLSMIILSSCSQQVTAPSVIPIEADGGVPINIQDYNGRIFNIFLTKELQLTNFTLDAEKSSFNVTVLNSTNCLVGDAIDLYDDSDYFQGIITDVIGSVITFTPRLPNNFSKENTFVKCGEWNLAVDGSVTQQRFYTNPPTNSNWDVESFAVQFKDNADYDISTFGSRTQLENGFTAGIRDGQMIQFFLIYNNGGFKLRGFDISQIEKAPSGQYGFTANLLFEKTFGAIPELFGADNDRFVVNINDDLTSQTEIAAVIRGHYKDE